MTGIILLYVICIQRSPQTNRYYIIIKYYIGRRVFDFRNR